MVLSCLVEPLVAPLVGRPGARGRTALSRRMVATALMVSALAAVTTNAHTADTVKKLKHGEQAEAASIRNAHQKPAAIPYREVLAQYALPALRKQELEEPGEAAEFESRALRQGRLRPGPDLQRPDGSSLGLHRRLDALRRARSLTYLTFGAGQHRSGAPNPQFA
jgi:hypothetical protein